MKLNTLQQKDLIFKYSPYPYVTEVYINPPTQSLSMNDLSNFDREWIKENSYVFDYRTFNGESGFVWKLDDLSDDSYTILPCANKIVIKNYGEMMVSAQILELRMFNSLNSDEHSIYKGAGTIHRILKENGECDSWEIPVTFVSGRADDVCKAAKEYIGVNVLGKPCPQSVTVWAKLEIDVAVQNRMGETRNCTLQIINSELQTYSATILHE